MDLCSLVVAPFVESDSIRYVLASISCLVLSATPVGAFLVMRRISLVGDTLSHAVLPGVAIGYMFAGLSSSAMSVGGFVAGLLMALLTGLVSRFTSLKESANFATFYLSSLAIGVVLISKNGNSIDLLHLLFGSVLTVDIPALQLTVVSTSVIVLSMAVMFHPLVLESIDPLLLKAVGGKGGFWHILFLVLVVMNLVTGFQVLGALVPVGLMVLSATTTRPRAKGVGWLTILFVALASLCSLAELLFSCRIEIPSGSATILCYGTLYLISVVFGWKGGILAKWPRRKKHRTT